MGGGLTNPPSGPSNFRIIKVRCFPASHYRTTDTCSGGSHCLPVAGTRSSFLLDFGIPGGMGAPGGISQLSV